MKKETQTIEFKQSWHDDFLKEICGFANVQGGEGKVRGKVRV